jgi:hypothetical protein
VAKPTIRRSSIGSWTPQIRDQMIDKFVEIAGQLPSHQFEILAWEKDKVVTYRGSARAKLHSEIIFAHHEYLVGDQSQRLAQAKQLLTQLNRIEAAAHSLLVLVASGSPAIVDTFGLRDIVEEEQNHLRDALGKVLQRVDFERLGLSSRSFSNTARIEGAVEGVKSLHRWAKAAAEQNKRRIARIHTKREEFGNARHKGDVGLNRYIECVVIGCWCEVWGRQILDGPKLWKFVMVAADAVGVPLSKEASRERIRRIFGLRRANRKGLNLDLPKE